MYVHNNPINHIDPLGLVATVSPSDKFRPEYEKLLQEQYEVQREQFVNSNLVSMMSGSSASKVARQRGVDRFWREEAERIKQGKPSRKWTAEQEEAILRGETPKSAVDRKPVEGAHKKRVQDNPELADNPENVEAKSFTEHRKKDSGEHSTNPKQHEISPNTTP